MTGQPFPPEPVQGEVVAVLVTRAFPDGDPLDYSELTAEQVALRMLLAALADTGAAAVFPAHLAPSWVQMVVACGWLLEPEVSGPDAQGQARLTVRWGRPVAERFPAGQPWQERQQ